MPQFKVVGKIQAYVTKYVEAVDEQAAFEAACDSWQFDDLDASEAGTIYDPSITLVPETTAATHYGATAPTEWFAKGGGDPEAPVAS